MSRRWYVCPMLLVDILDDNEQPTGRQIWMSKIYNLGYRNHTIVLGDPAVKPWCLCYVRSDDWITIDLDLPDIALVGEVPDNEPDSWFYTQTFNTLGTSNADKNKFKNMLSGQGIDHSALDDDSPMLDWMELVRADLGGNSIVGSSV